MAIILKEGKTFNPAISAQFGVDMTSTTYYGVIDRIEYDKNEKKCFFVIDIYGSNSLRMKSASIVDRIHLNIAPDQFDETVGSDGLSITKAYSLALQKLTDWESDE